jgi:hypothetical protein
MELDQPGGRQRGGARLFADGRALVSRRCRVLELAEVVRELRNELTRAMAAGEGAQLQFEVGEIELELTLGVKREAGAKAGIKFWVFELGGDARAESASTQKVKLRLDPKVAATGQRARISGQRVAGEK